MRTIVGLEAFKIYLQEAQKRRSGRLFSEEVERAVEEIIESVRINGDQSIDLYNQRFDQQQPGAPLLTPEEELVAAYEAMDPGFIEAIHRAIENVRNFHRAQRWEGFEMSTPKGSMLGNLVRPLERVAVYVPGGKAAYPSSVIMNVVPAQIAGVKEIYILTPPDREGKLNPYVAATAYALGIQKVYKAGGAQGVAAAAFGTETIPKADKIVGPGNAYVAAAKRAVFGFIAIDMIAGPSEIAVVADQGANGQWAAADLLSQAEHDQEARCFFITDSKQQLKTVQEQVELQLQTLERREIVQEALKNHGCLVLVENLEEAYEAVNLIAPEHLEILTERPREALSYLRHAGAIFLGAYASEPIGDYVAGPNHVLPTSGTAAFASPLSVQDFQKFSSLIEYTKEDFIANAPYGIKIAEAEGLTAHANAMKVRLSQ